MLDPSFEYTPRSILRPPPISLELLAAGRRASARHGTARNINPSTEGLHPWDLNLRSEPLGRENLIEETEKDLHDVVCALLVRCVFAALILTSC